MPAQSQPCWQHFFNWSKIFGCWLYCWALDSGMNQLNDQSSVFFGQWALCLFLFKLCPHISVRTQKKQSQKKHVKGYNWTPGLLQLYIWTKDRCDRTLSFAFFFFADNTDIFLTSLQQRCPVMFSSASYIHKKINKYHPFPVSAVIRFSHKKNSYLYFLDIGQCEEWIHGQNNSDRLEEQDIQDPHTLPVTNNRMGKAYKVNGVLFKVYSCDRS